MIALLALFAFSVGAMFGLFTACLMFSAHSEDQRAGDREADWLRRGAQGRGVHADRNRTQGGQDHAA